MNKLNEMNDNNLNIINQPQHIFDEQEIMEGSLCVVFVLDDDLSAFISLQLLFVWSRYVPITDELSLILLVNLHVKKNLT